MKALLILALFFTTLSAFANDATCLDGHTEEAEAKYKEQLLKGIDAALAKKSITIDHEKDLFYVDVNQINYETDGIYAYVGLRGATLTTAKGTELLVEYKQTSWGEAKEAGHDYFKPVRKAAGFDNEGNAIAAHCTLVSDQVRVNDRAEFIYITNATTGRFITRVELPKKVSVY